MATKIMKVFYDAYGLPYKDKERTVHYPITGGAFMGASQATEIRFYIDELGSINDVWVANSKLPNGKQGNELLTSGTDSELGEGYVKLSLKSFYTQMVGDLYISLNAFDGNMVVVEEDGVYQIQGEPKIQATGSIKISINYAVPLANGAIVGNAQDLQDLLAMMGELKSHKTDYLNFGVVLSGSNETDSEMVDALTDRDIHFIFAKINLDDPYTLFYRSTPTLYKGVPIGAINNLNGYNNETLSTIEFTDTTYENFTYTEGTFQSASTDYVNAKTGVELSGSITTTSNTLTNDDYNKLEKVPNFFRCDFYYNAGTAHIDDALFRLVDETWESGYIHKLKYRSVVLTNITTNQSVSVMVVNVEINMYLRSYSTNTDFATLAYKTYVDSAIRQAISSVYRFKGTLTVSELNALSSGSLTVGDVYNLSNGGHITLGNFDVMAGDNVAWTGSAWDKFASSADLSGYYTKTQVDNLIDGVMASVNQKASKEELQDIINGTTPVAKSLVSEQLENVSDESGTYQTNPFTFQASGTDNNTTETPVSPVAKQLELRGNAINFTQLVGNGNLASNSGWGAVNSDYSTFSISDNVGTLTITSVAGTSSYNGVRNTNVFNLIKNHKYLIKFDTKVNQGTTNLRYAIYQFYGESSTLDQNFESDSSWTTFSNILTCNYTKEQTSILFWWKSGETLNTGDSFDIRNVMVVDLTLLYGVGKEPTTYLEFVRDFPVPYYETTTGFLIGCQCDELVNIGYNQCDGVVEGGSISNVDGTNNVNNSNFRVKNPIRVIGGYEYSIEWNGTELDGSIYVLEYDILMNYLGYTPFYNGVNGTVTLRPNTRFVRIHCYKQDSDWGVNVPTNSQICFHLTWDGSRTGFEDYVKHTYSLPNVELRSAGSVYDDIQPNGTYTQRVGWVNLGTLDWEKVTNSSGASVFQSTGLNGLIAEVDQNTICNITCAGFTTETGYNVWFASTGRFVSATKGESLTQVGIIDMTKSSLSASEFKTAMNGVIMFYELAEPVVTQVSSFSENVLVDDFGTMYFHDINDVGNSNPITPQGNKFFYPADYVLLIDDLYNYTEGDVTNLALLSDIPSGGGSANALDISFGGVNAYDNTATYVVGDKCSYQGKLYKCSTAITSAEDFDVTHWTEITLNDYAELNGSNTFTKKLSAEGGIDTWQIIRQGIQRLYFDQWSATVSSRTIIPLTSNDELGSSSNKWKNIYLAGGFNPNTSGYKLTLPDTTSWTADKEIATTDQLSLRQFDAPSNSELTDEMVEALKSGVIILNGSVRTASVTYHNPILLKAQYSGTGDMWGWCFTYSSSLERPQLREYRINQSNKKFAFSDYNWLELYNIGSLNGKTIPAYPSSTGTFVLKCVDGTLTWVQE